MTPAPDRAPWFRRLPRWEAGVAILAAAGAALAFVAARYALEVVVVLLALGLLVVVQRTVADWLRDLFGAATVNVALAGLVVTGLWIAFGSDDGRRQVKKVVAEADRRGFRTLWIDASGVEVPRPRGSLAPSGGGGAESGGAGPAAGSAGAAARESRAAGGRTTASGARAASGGGAVAGGTTAGGSSAAPRPSGGSGSAPANATRGATNAGAPRPAATDVWVRPDRELAPRRDTPRDGSLPGAHQPATLRIQVGTDRPVAGEPVLVSVEADAPLGGVPGGEVELSVGGKLLARRELDRDGRAAFRLLGLTAGGYRLDVRLVSERWLAGPATTTLRVEHE